ncbi:MAG: ArsR/SmtB family transcription factor [Armatimonadota bacterium]
MDQAVYESRAEVMKALAHPSRLIIVDALADGERCVCELQELVGSTMPTVSRHLSQMKNAGIVEGRRDGNQVYYRLLVPCVLKVFPCLDAVLRNEAERMAEALEA